MFMEDLVSWIRVNTKKPLVTWGADMCVIFGRSLVAVGAYWHIPALGGAPNFEITPGDARCLVTGL